MQINEKNTYSSNKRRLINRPVFYCCYQCQDNPPELDDENFCETCNIQR